MTPLNELIYLLGSDPRFHLSGHSLSELEDVVAFYMPTLTPSERIDLAEDLRDWLRGDINNGD